MSAKLFGILVAPGLVLGLQGRGARPRAAAHRAGRGFGRGRPRPLLDGLAGGAALSSGRKAPARSSLPPLAGSRSAGNRPASQVGGAAVQRAGDAESDRADFEAKAYGDNKSISRKGPGKPGGFRASGS